MMEKDKEYGVEMHLKPIGIIHSPFAESGGTPIQVKFAGDVEGSIEFFEEFVPALKDLDGFERIWLLFWFDRAKEYKPLITPYLETVKRGLFATRAPSRPNPIGVSCVKLLGIKANILKIGGLDILDGTPLLDIKPYAPRFDCFEVSRSGWLDGVGDREARADGRFQGK